ncbi:hypothetical protein [Phenylobacterium sp. J367]|uniref:hypothetical protein n=1 Tax=Phenylobacterium sp. J367 TaxID=2898435 RepID=UPI002150A6D1|nr:hypothetical protein [Phenylobacterium sp. J367]MCR5879283.1 hypothetical protein [Phenylobacterium sp. J367]
MIGIAVKGGRVVATAVDVVDTCKDRASGARAGQGLPDRRRRSARAPHLGVDPAAGVPDDRGGALDLVVSRLVETEREKIRLLKAFGSSDPAAAAPYL